MKPKLTDAQCGFRPGRSTMDQIFALQQVFEKSWEYAKEVNACFVDLEKAYDRIPRDKLWAMLLQANVFCLIEICVWEVATIFQPAIP